MGMQDGDVIKKLETNLAVAMKQIELMQKERATPMGSKGTPSSATATSPSPSQPNSRKVTPKATPKASITPKAAAAKSAPKASPLVGSHTYGVNDSCISTSCTCEPK